jgi:putative nucleotidyltransferase with HDIG domain
MLYAVGIARSMDVASEQLKVIRHAAMIHDIGKIGVPDAVLAKPDRLTPRERRIIEQHPLIAVRILEKMTFLEQEIAIVRHHHEKWNGQGYPDGITNSAIPLGALIMAVADTLDALTSTRTYRQARSLDQAIEILVDASGYDYAPKVILGMVSWVDNVRRRMSKEHLTTEDLLNSQRQLDKKSPPLLATSKAVH